MLKAYYFSPVNSKNLAYLPLFSLGFPGGSVVKNPPANARDAGSIPGSGRSPGEGNGHPLLYSCLGNPMDRGAWRATVLWGSRRVGHNLATEQQPLFSLAAASLLGFLSIPAPYLQHKEENLCSQFSLLQKTKRPLKIWGDRSFSKMYFYFLISLFFLNKRFYFEAIIDSEGVAKIVQIGNFLVVQCLGLWAFTAKGTGSIPG